MEELIPLIQDACNQLGVAVSAGMDAVIRFYLIKGIVDIIAGVCVVLLICLTIGIGLKSILKSYNKYKEDDHNSWDCFFETPAPWAMMVTMFIIVLTGCIFFAITGNNLPNALEPMGAVIYNIVTSVTGG